MYDDDLYNFDLLNSYTSTETEEETETEESQSFNPYQTSNPYVDDYTTSQNYEEERSYNSRQSSNEIEEVNTGVIRQMDKPTIIQQAPAVKLTIKKEKMYLSARLKIAATVFFIIFAAIIFASVWNFAQAGIMQARFDTKQTEISQLENSINELTIKYNELNNPNSTINGYVEKVEGVNSFTLSLDNFAFEPEVGFVDSNWFNDVCEFFRNIFA